jgi:lipoprotein antigen
MAFSCRAISIFGISAALIVGIGGCSDDKSAGSDESADTPTVTTIDLTLGSQPVDLADAAMKCYDHEGHLSLEAFKKDDREATHFLMDYFKNEVGLSIGIKGAQPDLYEYTPGKPKQSAKVTRDGNSVTVTGMIGVALDDTTPPKPFSIKADCSEFVDSAPDSSGI